MSNQSAIDRFNKSFGHYLSAAKALLFPVTSEFKNKGGAAWLVVAQSDDSAEMVIEGSIGESFYDESGTSSKQFRSALGAIPKGKPITLRINSPGGAVGDALSIYNQVKERGNITTRVDGYALSSASIIALGGDKCVMPKSAIMMIHDPLSYTYGNEEEHKKSVEMLKVHAETMAQIYADKSGMTPVECRDLMKTECWMSGEDALEKGFTDELDEDPEEDTSARAKVAALDLSKFEHVPQAVLAMAQPISAGPTPAATSATPPIPNQDTQTMPPTNAPAAAAPPATPNTPATPAAATPAAVDVVSRAEFDAMKSQMQAEKKARVEAKLDQLISDTKLSNDEREEELKLCMADDKRLEVLEKRQPQFQVGPPLGGAQDIQVIGNFIEKIRAMKWTGEPHRVGGQEAVAAQMRFIERRDNWSEMYSQALQMDRRGKPRINGGSNPLVKFVQAQPLPGTDSGYCLPVAASTYSTSLIVDQLADGAISQLVNTLAPLRVFTRDFMASPFMPLASVQVRLVTQGGQQTKFVKPTGSVTSTTTDYEANADHAVSNVAITMTEYSEAFMTTSGELQSGLRIEYLANNALMTLGSNIISDTLVLLNTASFSAGPSGGSLTAHYGTWTWNSLSSTVNDMAVLRSQLGKSSLKNAVLDPVLFSKLITVPVANQMQVGMPMANANTMRSIMGWDEIAETTAWGTGQGAGGSTGSFPQPIIGFACHPQAIAVAARLPLLPPEGVPGNTVTMATVTVPGLDMSIAIFQWFSPRYRTLFHSYGIVFGPAAGDLTAGCVVKSLGV